MRRSAWLSLLTASAAVALVSPPAAAAQTAATEASTRNLLLLEVTLGGERLTEDLYSYEHGTDVLLPLGELARLLTIGIRVDAATQTAAGFVLREDRPFRLDATPGSVLLPDGRASYDPDLVRWIDGDVYVASRLLQRWLPVALDLDLAALRLAVRPREKLPLQTRIERERKVASLGRRQPAIDGAPGYPYARAGYRLLSLPFSDNSVSFDMQNSGGKLSTRAAYSSLLTGDLLGMESAIHLAASNSIGTPEARVTLARHDPEAGLVGPLKARTLLLGAVAVPAVNNVLRGTGNGDGLLISNRPLTLPSSFQLQTLRGELLPGWDVTLYFNGALIAFQQARADGLYEFRDQPLVFGRNEFMLVFNGPLGQTRIERQVFEVDSSLGAPGTLYYTAASQRDDNGDRRHMLQLDFGLLDNLGVAFGGSRIDARAAPGAFYANAGARAAMLGMLINMDHVRATGGGHLTELGLRTGLWGLSLDAAHIWMKDYASDFFSGGRLSSQSRARVTGALQLSGRLSLPLSLDVVREKSPSGDSVMEVQQRLSLNVFGTSFTNMMTLRAANGPDFMGAILQMNRRVAGVGLSGQMAYGVRPKVRLDSFAINADTTIGDASRASLGIIHGFDREETMLAAGINRNFGSFGLGVSGRFGGTRSYGLGLQLFTALGRDPRSGRLVSDWQPMAGSGVVSARVFIDDNQNGRFDAGEDPVAGAGLAINGSRHPARSDPAGSVVIHRLPPQQYADVSLDLGTLEDVQLQPATPGVRLLPRPGKVQPIDFPLVITGEIDGTVYFEEGENQARGIGNALVELLDAHGTVVAATRSTSDGFYVMAGVRPGHYRLRIAPEQTKDLGLVANHEPMVTMPAEADFISGIDFRLKKAP